MAGCNVKPVKNVEGKSVDMIYEDKFEEKALLNLSHLCQLRQDRFRFKSNDPIIPQILRIICIYHLWTDQDRVILFTAVMLSSTCCIFAVFV